MAENSENYLTNTDVCSKLGISTVTLATWYTFYNSLTEEEKKGVPPLPKFIRKPEHSPNGRKFWKPEDIEMLIEFQNWKKSGKNGQMGSINCRYWRPEAAIRSLLAKNDIDALHKNWPYFKNRVHTIQNPEILKRLKELGFIDEDGNNKID